MLKISCKDIAPECDFVGRANSEDELIMQLLGHIIKDHRSNMAEIMKPEIRKKIRANIQKS
jgi:predicted small metal-binding protein